jgi:hypothetical protein
MELPEKSSGMRDDRCPRGFGSLVHLSIQDVRELPDL